MKTSCLPAFTLSIAFAALATSGQLAAEGPRTGPETEKRFPSLKLPPGFQATLYACDPFIEYPSVIALGPRAGALFVAIDYMTGLGTEIVRRDEIRLLEDADGDGYADRSTVYAAGFNSIQGLTYQDGAVYVMHSPFLTRLRDVDGDGKADERRDLLEGLGLPPEKNPVRLHCANGVAAGHDGWLYLSLGDHGADVTRPEGDRLVLRGGGILRCRPDGRDLHVFATGLRNIYDVALDDELNVFVRDNENDGGDYKIRVYHSFYGADHGYPYLYTERPREALAPLADLGLGSSAGGVSYQEEQFPKEFRGNLYFCEWGRAVVRYAPRRAGSSFTPLKEVEFAAGASNDPYGFKPTDVVVGYDGSLFVSDWADGQRPKRGRGRIYQIRFGDGPRLPQAAPTGPEAPLERLRSQLTSTSFHERCAAQLALEKRGAEGVAALDPASLSVHGRMHAVWIVAHGVGSAALDRLFEVARNDPEPRVQAQAIRAIADLVDPVLVRHRLDAAPGDAGVASRLAALAEGSDSRVQLEVIVALARLQWQGAPAWARAALPRPDAAQSHALQQMLRRSGNWPGVLTGLDELHGSPIRAIAACALADQAVSEIVTELFCRLAREPAAARRLEFADLLTRVHRLPGPQPYWGYRPAPRPPNTVPWIATAAIEESLDRTLVDPDLEVRGAVLQRMQRERIPARPAKLQAWLRVEWEPKRVSLLLESLRQQPAAAVRDDLQEFLLDPAREASQRQIALAAWTGGLDAGSEDRLLALADRLEDGPLLAALLRATIQRPGLRSEPMLVRKLRSPAPEVRTAALEALAERTSDGANTSVQALLADSDATVRQAAAAAAGKLKLINAADRLLELARDGDGGVRRASLDSLRHLRDGRALSLAVAGLENRTTEPTALAYVAEFGGPAQTAAVLKLVTHSPAGDVLVGAVRAFSTWAERGDTTAAQKQELTRAVAKVQGTHGVFLQWRTLGPIRPESVPALVEQFAFDVPTSGWQTLTTSGTDVPIRLGQAKGADKDAVWLAHAECSVAEDTAAQFQAANTGTLNVWLNGQPLDLRPEPSRFAGTLTKGLNRVLVQVSGATAAVNLQLSFRRRGANAQLEQLAQAALSRPGNAERGRNIFMDVDKSLCLKCHHLGDQGERIGPELTGLGSRFSRIHIVESILEPSRAVAPSFQTLRVVLKNGRTLNGLKIAENEIAFTLADQQGDKHVLAKADVDEQQPIHTSVMPEGLEKRLSAEEFVDLVAFLARQKEAASR